MEATVRAATPADVAPSIELLFQIGAEPDSALGTLKANPAELVERLTNWLHSGEHDVLVAVSGDRLIGSLWLVRDHWVAEIKLNVAADWRDRGVGRALMAAAEDVARAAGVRKVWLGVYGPNARARALYEHLGYVVEGVQREQYPRPDAGAAWDQVFMAKFLDRPA